VGFFVCGMMGRFEYMHKKAIFILLLIIYSGDIRTQNFDELPLYISPGLQIGYHFGSNLYFSYQVTTGLYVDTPLSSWHHNRKKALLLQIQKQVQKR
jgi:hypothetical protein